MLGCRFGQFDSTPQWEFLSQVLPAHSTVMSRLDINLVEGKVEREKQPSYMPWFRNAKSLTLHVPTGNEPMQPLPFNCASGR